MNAKFLSAFTCLFSLLHMSVYGQALVLDSLTQLEPVLGEISGLEYLNGKLIGHTDSGGENALYEIDPQSGTVVRKVIVSNASNIDWEDICADHSHLYIADIGNNNGDRQDLRIYRLSIQEFFASDTVLADTISISYTAQTDFTPMRFMTNFDAEALVSVGDSLYIFSKNWGNQKSYIYTLPKVPSSYQLEIRDSLDTEGLITGGDYDEQNDRLSLSGYTFSSAFYLEIENPDFADISSSFFSRIGLVFDNSFQLESLCFTDSIFMYVGTEGSTSSAAVLYSLFVDFAGSIQTVNSPDINVYPNPSTGKLKIESPYPANYRLYTMNGKLVSKGDNSVIEVKDLPKGYYWLKVEIPSKEWIDVRKLLLH
ncbi:MAG: T9SS type A sorting domain-containing protein [Bacteroidota bacterium]